MYVRERTNEIQETNHPVRYVLVSVQIFKVLFVDSSANEDRKQKPNHHVW